MATKKMIIDRIYSAFNGIDFSGEIYESIIEEREALVAWVKINVKTYDDMEAEDEGYVKADLIDWLDFNPLFTDYYEFEDYIYAYAEQVDGSMVLGSNQIRKICADVLKKRYALDVDKLD